MLFLFLLSGFLVDFHSVTVFISAQLPRKYRIAHSLRSTMYYSSLSWGILLSIHLWIQLDNIPPLKLFSTCTRDLLKARIPPLRLGCGSQLEGQTFIAKLCLSTPSVVHIVIHFVPIFDLLDVACLLTAPHSYMNVTLG